MIYQSRMQKNILVVCFVLFMNLFTVVHAETLKPQPGAKKTLRNALTTQKVMRALYTDVALCESRLIVVGDRGQIVYSNDSGINWLQATVPVNQLLTAVFFVGKKGWAVGHDGIILHSQDCGLNWQVQHHVPFENQSHISLAGSQSTEGTNISDASDSSSDVWDEFDNKKGTPLLDLYFFDENEGMAVGGYGLFLHTTDGGIHWNDWADHIDNPDGLHLNTLFVDQDGLAYLGGEMGILFRSSDKGAHWQPMTSPTEASIYGIHLTKAQTIKKIFIFGLGGALYASKDAGNSWEKIETSLTTNLNMALELASGTLFITTNSGALLKSDKQGLTFSLLPTGEKTALVGVVESVDHALIIVGQHGIKRLTQY